MLLEILVIVSFPELLGFGPILLGFLLLAKMFHTLMREYRMQRRGKAIDIAVGGSSKERRILSSDRKSETLFDSSR